MSLEVLASPPHPETPQPGNDAGGNSPGLQKENPFFGKQEADVPSQGLVLCLFITVKTISALIQEAQKFF